MAVNEELLKKVLEEIRPNLQADGGDMEYVGVDDEGVVQLELQGACAGCPMSALTLSMGIERILKEHVPGVTRVERSMPPARPTTCTTSTRRFKMRKLRTAYSA